MKSENKSSKLPWSPWVALFWVIFLFFASQFFAALLVSIYPHLVNWSDAQTNHWLNDSTWEQFVYIFIAEGLTIGGLAWFLTFFKKRFSDIGLKRPRWVDPLYGLAAAPVYYISYFAIVVVVGALLPSLNVNQQQDIGFQHAAGTDGLILVFVSLVILPPLVEEIMVRGFLYGSLRERMPKLTAALVASALFASAHLLEGTTSLLWVGFLDTFVLSMVLVYLREKTGSLWASITLHTLKNGVAFVALFILHVS